MKPVNLVMVTASANNNKFYRMIPEGDQFLVEYGRIGNPSFQTARYPMSEWDKKYREKTKKGYQDKSDLVEELVSQVAAPGETKYSEIANKVIADIVNRLQRMARKAIATHYTIESTRVTKAMVDEAQTILGGLGLITSLDKFNDTLLELFAVIPRKMKKVAMFLAESDADFGKIIQAEQDLLDVMRGQVVQNARAPKTIEEAAKGNVESNLLEELGLDFYEVTDADVAKIKKALGGASGQFVRAWRVENRATQAKFDKFISDEKIKDCKLLWHGSRNENWWSIINGGLVLRPTNAVITGKMFGYGTYFATKARKSIGYTSLSGSYWASGSESSAFMGLYDVAYGTPYDTHSFDSKFYDLNYDRLQNFKKGAHCLHAHEGSMLRNDEIVVYKEEQTTIKYLVEIKN